jgi:FkbM family methyltransferase
MFSSLLTGISSKLPTSVKYQLKGLRRPYTFFMRLGRPVVRVPSLAGPINWEIDELTSQQLLRGTYERHMQEAFAKFIRKGDVVYDVGAFAGYHSLLCGLLVGSTGRVFAFEPHPLNCDSIQRQLRLNPAVNVTLMPFALSDLNASVFFSTHAGRSQTHVSDTGDLSAETKRIDDLVESGVLPPPNLIKIDVEGHEERVLRGGMKTIARHGPIVLCDHNDSSTFETVRDLLSPLGYEVSNGLLVTGTPL